MAPSKRSRAVSEEESDAESGSDGSSTTVARKRARTASSEPSESQNDNRNTANNEDSDASSDDSEAAYLERLEALKQRDGAGTQGASIWDEDPPAADAGILTKVECINFMCHDNLCVEISPFMTFIVGNNGSGKSAVLTALTLCLGSKAASTNRAKNLSSLIKTGRDYATVKVHIKNEGEDAYRPNDYGDEIVVERHFTRAGTSGFKLRSSANRIVSTKRGDLDDICDFFTLQMDNPLNVLSQDQARAFLSSSEPKTKYKFFMKGVQLEQLDSDYKFIEEKVDSIEAKLGTRMGDVKSLEDAMKKAKHKLDMSDRHKATRERIKELRGQMAWAQIEVIEHRIEQCNLAVEKKEAEIAANERNIGKLSSMFDEQDRTAQDAKALVEEQKQEYARKQEHKQQLLAELNEFKSARQQAHDQERLIATALRTQEKRVAKVEQDIEEENQRLEDLNGGSDARLRAAFEEREEAAAEAAQSFEEHRRAKPDVEDAVRAAQHRLGRATDVYAAKNDEVDRADVRVKELQRTRGQQQSAFGEKLPLLLRAIDQETRFRAKPVGPLGQHIRLLKPEWSSIIESTLGDSLKSFAVVSKQDQTLLSGIMSRIGFSLPIIIGSFEPLDTSRHEPDPQYLTIMRALEFENEAVRRQLVISQGIEQMLLIQDQDEAHRVMYEGPRPQNVRMCFHMHPKRRGYGLRLGYSRNGDAVSGPVRPFTDKPRIKTDVESQIRIATDTLQDLRRERKDLDDARRQAEEAHVKAKQAVVRHEREESRIRFEVQRTQEAVDIAREELEKASVEVGRLDALKEGLKEAQDELATHRGSYSDAIEAKEAATQRMKPARDKCNACDEEIAAVEARIANLEEEVQRITTKRERALREKNNAFAGLENLRHTIAEIQQKKAEEEEVLIAHSAEAQKISDRVPVPEKENTNSLEAKLVRLQKDRERHERELGGTRAELVQKATDSHAAYTRARKAIREFEILGQVLKRSLVERKIRWDKFQQIITARAKANFVHLLSNRGFKGKVLANHKTREMDIQVEPDATRASDGRGAKTLSGGEKSFAQICLLLALWEAMGSPIRCLDEFDVFMDSVNRKISIGLIVEAARNSLAKQFVLISPGTKSDITLRKGVNVVQLKAPERATQASASQRVLPFTAAA